MTQDMQEYDPDRPCPKCGTRHSTTQYLSEWRPPPPTPESEERSLLGWSPRLDKRAWMWPMCEHQRRTCQHCGYVWAEACVGAIVDLPVPGDA